MKVDLIRHAKSISNEKEIFSGSNDTPLSDEGELSAIKLSELMKNEEYTKHFSSPLSRAFKTATILFPNKEIITDPYLAERSLGQWEGKLKKEMRLHYPHAFLPSGKLNPLFTPPNGEDISRVAKRLIDFFQLQTHDHVHRIVVVTHNGIIRTLRALIEDLPIEKSFVEAEKNLQVRSYEIDNTILNLMREKQLALAEAIREL